jgi:alpha-D-xyloside xylohydrolase
MIRDLGEQGFKISLWQLPYFTPQNRLFGEIVENGYAVKDERGGRATEDAILDFSNPKAVAWYQKNLEELLKMGVGAIKVDFGEAAPVRGLYASGTSGFIEHNLYPLRYNQAVAEVTRAVTGESIIWARSAWAGSQRYPLHWGGDPEDTGSAMAATLRAGLSFGLSGFSFWSHDIGGFVHPPAEDLYRRWLPFGMLTSHSRCHGVPPREPWAYNEAFVDDFRRGVELKYRLMPYVWAQAQDSAHRGFPMLRALFVEYPDDPTSWLVEDEYLFGRDILVAPLFEDRAASRLVYLPPGGWIDYQTGRSYEGSRWHTIEAGPIAAVILVREGAVVPHAPVAQSTSSIEWGKIELLVFARPARNTENGAPEIAEASGLVCIPPDGALLSLRARRAGDRWVLDERSEPQQKSWPIRAFGADLLADRR